MKIQLKLKKDKSVTLTYWMNGTSVRPLVSLLIVFNVMSTFPLKAQFQDKIWESFKDIP